MGNGAQPHRGDVTTSWDGADQSLSALSNRIVQQQGKAASGRLPIRFPCCVLAVNEKPGGGG